MISTILLPLINRLVQHDTHVLGVLHRHQGKVIALNLAEWPKEWRLLVTQSGLVLLDTEVDVVADGTVDWSIVDVHRLLLSSSTSKDLHLSGSVLFLQEIFQAYSQAEWDALPLLADHIGAYGASSIHEVFYTLKGACTYLHQACLDTLNIQLHTQYATTTDHEAFRDLLHATQRSIERMDHRLDKLCQ